MLLMGDVFAVAWYHKHAQWNTLKGLFRWIFVGMAAGVWLLIKTGESASTKDMLGMIIGSLVLIMLILHLLRSKLGDKLTPTSRLGVASTGAAAGFATTVANAAGPVMQLYLSAHKLPKQQFMGTIAWYFFIINLSKFPIYIILSREFPQKPMLTSESLLLNAAVAPAVVAGVYAGKWLLPHIPQKAFQGIVLLLTGAGAVNLIYAYLR